MTNTQERAQRAEQTILVDTTQAGFNLQKYLNCLKEHQGKNTVIFVSEGYWACDFGPSVVYPDNSVRWYQLEGEVTRSDWIEMSKDIDMMGWESGYKKIFAMLLLKYTDCPMNSKPNVLDAVLFQHSVNILPMADWP